MKNIVLLHGAIGSKDQLFPLEELLKKNFNVYRMNFSGHGGKEFQSAFNIPQFAHELEQYLSDNALQNANIFGYSMGGYVAFYLAKHHPSLVGKIMTLGTKFNWTPKIAEKEIKMLNPDLIEQKIPNFAQALSMRHQPLDWKQVLAKTATMMLDMGKENTLTLADYESILIPVKIGLADQDEMMTTEETHAVVNELSNGSFYSLSHSKHPIEQVNLNQLNEEIIQFFS